MAKRGQPEVFSPERASKAIEAIRAGNYRRVAADIAGISLTTLSKWIKGARDGDPKYAEFANALKEAEAAAEARMVAVIQTAAIDQWQAGAWWLERKNPERWGRKDTVKLQPLPDPERLTPAQLEAAIKAALEAKARIK